MLFTHSEYKELATLCFMEKEVKEPTGFRVVHEPQARHRVSGRVKECENVTHIDDFVGVALKVDLCSLNHDLPKALPPDGHLSPAYTG